MDADKEREAIGPMLADLGPKLIQVLDRDLDGTLLYVEAGDGWISPSLWHPDGDAVRYHDTTDELTDLVWDILNATAPERRWSTMIYYVTGTRFQTEFGYPDTNPVEIDLDKERERLEVVLDRFFPGKHPVYPPWPGADE